MIVACEKCGTRFNVDETRIKDDGSRVRCSQCKHIFTIFKPAPLTAPEEKTVTPALEDDSLTGFDTGSAQTEQTDFDRELASLEDDLGLDDDFSPAGDSSDLDEDTESGPADFASFEDEFGLDDDFGAGAGSKSSGEAMDFGDLEKELGLTDDLGFGEPEAGEDEKSEADTGFDDDLDFGALGDDLGFGGDAGKAGAERIGLDDSEDDLKFPDDDFGDLGGLSIEEDGQADDEAEVTDFGSVEDDIFGLEDTPRRAERAEEKPEEEDEDDDYAFIDSEDDVTAGQIVTRPEKKRGGLLWFLVFILLLVAAGAGVFYFAPELLTPVLKPLGLAGEPAENKTDPMGNKLISLENEKHFFRVNEHAGQILIITGQAKNQYEEPRSYIRLKGVLQDDKGNILAQRQVHGGNVLSEEQLTSMTVEDINKTLGARSGQNNANMSIAPGKSVNFMIVFDKIPANLAEYTVEVFSSEPAQQK